MSSGYKQTLHGREQTQDSKSVDFNYGSFNHSFKKSKPNYYKKQTDKRNKGQQQKTQKEQTLLTPSPNPILTPSGKINFDTTSILYYGQSKQNNDLPLTDKIKCWNDVVNDVLFLKKSIIEKIKSKDNGSVFDYLGEPTKEDKSTVCFPQHYFHVKEGKLIKDYKRTITYKEAIGKDSIQIDRLFTYNTKHSWDCNFWIALLPKFEMKLDELKQCFNIEFVNNLLGIFSETRGLEQP